MPRLISLFAASAVALLIPTAVAQTPAAAPAAHTPTVKEPGYTVPRTSFGQPSFEGMWISNFVLPLESSDRAPMLTLPEAAAKQMALAYAKGIGDALDKDLDPEVPELMRNVEGLAMVRGERRTRAIVDPPNGRLPYKTDANRRGFREGFNNPEERPNWERCVRSLGQPPVFPIGEGNPRYFVQRPDQIVLMTEYGGEARIIPYTDTHKPKMFWTLLGDSIARWEGDTLVIETIGLPEKDRSRLFPTFVVSHNAKVTERYTRMSDKELLYQFTVDDPTVYTQPWTGEFSVYKTASKMYEHACHEGNYAMNNILRAERVKEERLAKQPVKTAAADAPKQ